MTLRSASKPTSVLSRQIEDLDKMVMATEGTGRKCVVTSGQVKKVKAQLDEMEKWAEANLEDLRSRKRNDLQEEQACGCFKAKLRTRKSERRVNDLLRSF